MKAVAAVLGLARLAAADPFPTEVVDRPIVLPSGMSALNVDYAVPQYLEATTDAMGRTIYSKQPFGNGSTAEVLFEHAFGPAELFIGIGGGIHGGVEIATGSIPAAVRISASTRVTGPTGDYFYAEGFGFSHKLVVRPHAFAVFGGAGMSLVEASATTDTGRVTGHEVSLAGDVGGAIEMRRDLALYLTTTVQGPVDQSAGFRDVAGIGLSAQLMYTFLISDFYARGAVTEAKGLLLPYLELGFVARWGQ